MENSESLQRISLLEEQLEMAMIVNTSIQVALETLIQEKTKEQLEDFNLRFKNNLQETLKVIKDQVEKESEPQTKSNDGE